MSQCWPYHLLVYAMLSIILYVSSRCLFMYGIPRKVFVILSVSNDSHFRLVFSLMSLRFLHIESLLVPLLIIESVYVSHFARQFTWLIFFSRCLGRSDGLWLRTYPISSDNNLIFGRLNSLLRVIGAGAVTSFRDLMACGVLLRILLKSSISFKGDWWVETQTFREERFCLRSVGTRIQHGLTSITKP